MPDFDDNALPDEDDTVLRPGDVLTPDDVAKILRVPPKTIVQLCREGRIPRAAKVGRQWRILRSAISLIFTESEAPPIARPSFGARRARQTPKPVSREVTREIPASKLSRAEILRMLRE